MQLKLEDFYNHFTDHAKDVSETISNLIQIIKKQNSEIEILKEKVNNLEEKYYKLERLF